MRLIAVISSAALLLSGGSAFAQGGDPGATVDLQDLVCGIDPNLEVNVVGKNLGLAWTCKPDARSSVYGVQGLCGFSEDGVCTHQGESGDQSCRSDLDCYIGTPCRDLFCDGGNNEFGQCVADIDCPGGGTCRPGIEFGRCSCAGGSDGVIIQAINSSTGHVKENVNKNNLQFQGKNEGNENTGHAPDSVITVVKVENGFRNLAVCQVNEIVAPNSSLDVTTKSKDALRAKGKGKAKIELGAGLVAGNCATDPGITAEEALVSFATLCDEKVNPFNKVVKLDKDLKGVQVKVSNATGSVDGDIVDD
jgi:hypothetical protein